MLAVGLVGCGGESRAVSPAASAALEADVEKIRAAAIASDLQTASQSLSDLRARVANLHAQGELNDAATDRILNEAAAVEKNLVLIPTTTTAPPAPPAPTAPQAGGNGPGNGKGKEKGKGNKDEGN
jgi:hypothetical protein